MQINKQHIKINCAKQIKLACKECVGTQNLNNFQQIIQVIEEVWHLSGGFGYLKPALEQVYYDQKTVNSTYLAVIKVTTIL